LFQLAHNVNDSIATTFLTRDVIYASRAYATMSVSVCLYVCPSVCDGSALWSRCMPGRGEGSSRAMLATARPSCCSLLSSIRWKLTAYHKVNTVAHFTGDVYKLITDGYKIVHFTGKINHCTLWNAVNFRLIEASTLFGILLPKITKIRSRCHRCVETRCRPTCKYVIFTCVYLEYCMHVGLTEYIVCDKVAKVSTYSAFP